MKAQRRAATHNEVIRMTNMGWQNLGSGSFKKEQTTVYFTTNVGWLYRHHNTTLSTHPGK